MIINFRVEYEPTPIRHIAVQCPSCGRWYHGNDITEDDLFYDYQAEMAEFQCPVCQTKFSCVDYCHDGVEICGTHIEECGSAEEVYAGCLTRKEVWE